MKFKIVTFLLLGFLFTYEVGEKLSNYDQLNEYTVCYGALNHGIGDGTMSLSDYNGSTSDFHVFMFELSAQWCGPCWNNIPDMANIEALYADNPNVLIITNLDDFGTGTQYRTCAEWGNQSTNYGGEPIILGDIPNNNLFGSLNTGSAYPSTVYIDHSMMVHYKGQNPSAGVAQTMINQMLDKLNNALLISANFITDFTNDVDLDGSMNPGDSFDIIINVMNKSHDPNKTASNVNLSLESGQGIIITSSNLGDIGNINADDDFQVIANIAISEDIVINDYMLNLIVTTDNINDEGDLVVEEFENISYIS